jgi:hypothetical protein
LLPRSGLERSDFVRWPKADDFVRCSKSSAIWGEPEAALPRARRYGPNRLATERFVALKRVISPKKATVLKPPCAAKGRLAAPTRYACHSPQSLAKAHPRSGWKMALDKLAALVEES